MTMTGYNSKLPSVLIPDQSGKRSPQEEAFWKFHQKNPMVYEAMVGLAQEVRRKRGPVAKLEAKRKGFTGESAGNSLSESWMAVSNSIKAIWLTMPG